MHLSNLDNSYFYNYKPSPRIVPQHCVLRILRKNKDKGNGVVILGWKLYNNAIEKIISDTSKFEKLSEDPTSKREASLKRFLCKKKTFLVKLNMITCIVLALLLLVYMVLLKYTNSSLLNYFLNFVGLFLLQVHLIIILPVSFVISFHL